MIFPTDLNVIEVSDSVKFDTSWFDSKYKVAVYMNKSRPVHNEPGLATCDIKQQGGGLPLLYLRKKTLPN